MEKPIKMGGKFLNIAIILSCFIASKNAIAQVTDTIRGEVSYKTSQNIYVRFQSTDGIKEGDTLYGEQNDIITPLLVVKYLSSTSCVGIQLNDAAIPLGTKMAALHEKELPKTETAAEVVTEMVPDIVPPEPEEEIVKEKEKKTESVKGKISAASYVYFSDHPGSNKQRMRYTFTMNANKIEGTKISAESYISFRHTLNEWQEVKDQFGKAFKVYSLALRYDFSENASIWAGRRINHNISNVGAIDGVQAEKNFKHLLFGAFAGSRPDHLDYGFNSRLLQFGAYAGYKKDTRNGLVQNTLAFAEQRNNGMTDRRFLYVQHLNSAIKDVYVFTSFEFDLYTLENGRPKSTFDISSIYASIRYKPFDKLSVFGAYDARKNIIYYETYKNIIDQLLEDETRQGLRFSFNYRPFKKITIGSSASYRFQNDNAFTSKNIHSYLTISRVPKINASASITATWIQSTYLNGLVYGIRASRDIIKGKLFGEVQFRKVENKYNSSETVLIQSIFSGNLSYRITKKFSLSANYEGEFYKGQVLHRIYTNIIQRF